MKRKKYKETELELIEKKMREVGKHYADFQKEELEKKRKWWRKGVTNGNS